MMPSDRPAARRAILLGLGAAGLAAGTARAVGPGHAALLVPGPEGGPLALWGQRLAALLARGAAGTATVIRLETEVLGGPDGVTAANRFATAAAPDGRTLLLLPGTACHARLIGDPRARFDPTGWLPLCGAEAPALVAGRAPVPAGPAAAPLRLALPAREHPATAALMGLDLLGITVQPIFGIALHQMEAALAQGAADAVVLQGIDAPARLAALGAQPWFALGPASRDVPVRSLGEAVAPLAPSTLRAALDTAGAAARVTGLLMLPALTPADLVALWRGAAQRWVEAARPGGPDSTADPASRSLGSPEAAVLLAALAVPPEAMRGYRDWLRLRLGWSPG
jgi:hypothetical protein